MIRRILFQKVLCLVFMLLGGLHTEGQTIYIWQNGTYNKVKIDSLSSNMPFVVTHDSIRIKNHVYCLSGIDSLTFIKPNHGLEYVFDIEYLPEIHLTIPLTEWNVLLNAYDQNPDTDKYISCSVIMDKGGEACKVDSAGLRLRGNTSRRRPEGNNGERHQSGNTNWHHCHYGLNLRKFVKDGFHDWRGVRKMYLKWLKDDPTYVREIYCYDLFRRFNIWTAINDSYCKLYIQIEGDKDESYLGVYEMMEVIDTQYLKNRKNEFGGSNGNLWKCKYGANLSDTGVSMGVDGEGEFVYTLHSNEDSLDLARVQLIDFIKKLKGKGDSSFYSWIKQVCDVELLLRTYAVNVVVGMWDDYWNNKNNYYLYFNNTDKYNYQFFFIPYDYDNTLGTSANCGVQIDAGRQDPYNWGSTENLLIYRLLKFEDFRSIYRQALNELINPQNSLFYYTTSIERINKWQSLIRHNLENDTNEDEILLDQPASWGNHGEYRLLDTGENNFFKVKATSIE